MKLRNLALLSGIALLLYACRQPAGAPPLSNHDNKLLHKVLLIRWKEDAPARDIGEMVMLWKKLAIKTEGFHSCNFRELESGNFGLAVFQVFDSRSALEAYRKDPDHQRIIEKGNLLIDQFTEFGYWE